jgi:hypothetical protein
MNHMVNELEVYLRILMHLKAGEVRLSIIPRLDWSIIKDDFHHKLFGS